MLEDFAGQSPEVEHLMRSAQAGRIVHAYLLSGGRGCGKRTLAKRLVRTLFCTAEPDRRPCGECPACKRVLTGNHPDVLVVAPEGRSILVEQVRDLLDELSRAPYEGGWRAIIIECADKMTVSAQNALLRTLESPARDTVFFLLTDTPGALLGTVRSRLWLVRVAPLSREKCAGVLEKHGVEPARALRLAGLAHGSVGRALEMQDGGFGALLARAVASLSSLRDAASVAVAAAPFYEEKERGEDILEVFETIGRDRMAAQNGLPPEALEAGELAALHADGRALLRGVCAARQKLSANVAWPSVLDELYFSLIGGLKNTGGT